ncbi:MAG: hypothetical protein JRH16_10590 [Deltaproteobacteria bacterium]|nr:hypothetical protein [Deltaproteobacteria bacterium]MBW2360433.1 hypothetical protein [Deltaproteobacteria bacterium]
MRRPWAHRSSRVAVYLLALACATSALAANVKRIEVLGAAPLDEATESRRSPRDRALRQALHAAVRQVATDELAGLVIPPEEGVLSGALGNDPFEYASRFRVLEDHGERQTLDPSGLGVVHEYVVLAEVHVDTARVRRRLAEAGLLAVPSGDGQGVQLRIVLEDLTSWSEIQAVRSLLRDLGARKPVPVELERGRAVLEVESSRSPERLLRELVRRAPDTLEIQPLSAGDDGLRLRARVLVPAQRATPDAARAFDTPEAERY